MRYLYIDKLIFENLPEKSTAIRFHQLADFLTTPLRVVCGGRTYCVSYSNNSLTEISRLKKTDHCVKHIFAFLATIIFSPFILIGLTIKLALKCNPTIQQIWNYRSQSSLKVMAWKCERIKGKPSNNFYYENDILAYSGQTQGNVPHGQGIFYSYRDGSKTYDGSWNNGLTHGQGTSYHRNGIKAYEGSWNNDQKHGQGTEYYDNGTKRYEGSWNNSYRHGHGTSYHRTSGTKSFEGMRENNHQKQGTVYREDGTRAYEGSWDNYSFPDGQGIEYGADGIEKIYEGPWKSGKKFINGKWIFDASHLVGLTRGEHLTIH